MKGKDLVFDFSQFAFVVAHPAGEKGDEKGVTGVAEHDSEKERETDGGVQTRIDLLIIGHSVSADERLKSFGEFIRTEVGRRFGIGRQFVQNRRESRITHILFQKKKACEKFKIYLW